MNGALAATRVHQEKVGLVRGVLVQLDPVAAVDDVPTLHPGHWLMTGSAGTPQTRSMRAHGSSEGHEMLKRNDKYHSIADDVPIPKM